MWLAEAEYKTQLETVFQDTLNPKLINGVIIYGAGWNCIDLLIMLIRSELVRQVKILCIADADENKQGGNIFGYPIIAPEKLSDYDKDTAVIITPEKSIFEITRRLEALGYKNFIFLNRGIYTQYLQGMAIYAQYNSQKEYWDNLLENNREIITKVRRSLSDDESRDIMDCFIAARFGCDFSQLENHIQTPEYYPEEIITFNKSLGQSGEVYVDCGVYDGRSAHEFAMRCPDYEFIYAFEPDPMQHKLSQAYIAQKKMERIELYNMGVWSSNGEIEFNSAGGGAGGVADEHTTFNSMFKGMTVKVKTTALDDLLLESGHKPTYIKMDIEGAELEALKGSVKIITRDKPRLAICVYHKPADIWEIPYWIMTNFPEYKLFLRQHQPYTDTVLYAI